MKANLIVTFLIAYLLASCNNFSKISDNQAKVIIQYNFVNISKGFDHETKTIVSLDGKPIAESEQHKESQKQTISFLAPKGESQLEIMNYALYRGQWEAHTKANNYGQDCFYKNTINIKRKTVIKLIFDLNEGTFVEVR